ncbi:MAG TPA: two-component regulator propeller domain-containing protein [Candidatus Paceibacterota bacterium]|nr:two-component regulator propeller domain-containing protein [Candidatus Paceibacterota bacterium]HRZ56350.1 two-component regulator propeller domain-containing protein [Candidatus Paceibacterota bacterium]
MALAVTNGLIRWWPNLFDTRDEISGQEGVVMGVVPPVEPGADDATELGRETGWVQLQPALTNEVFTLSFWVRCRAARPLGWEWLIGQEAGDIEWYFQAGRGGFDFLIGPLAWDQTNAAERARLTPEQWNHVALARQMDGTSLVWVDGVRQFDGRLAHPWPGQSRWLTVGNSPGGGECAFHGVVRDLCAFDRVLTDDEVRALHGSGVPRRPARNTRARLAATQRPMTMEACTNLVSPSAQTWSHRRFTTEDGLPGNVVTAVLQARNGLLWVGTDEGLARFDGRQFLGFTKQNTPVLEAIGHRVCSLAEDADQAIWAGIRGGLLRIRDGQCVAFTNGLPQRYVLQAMPAGGGWLWLAGFKTEGPPGPCWLRRYHPESGITSGETVVPGHPRQVVAVANGVWLATEQPQQIHFWDGRSAATAVVGTVDYATAAVRLGGGALLGEAAVRIWERGHPRTNRWVEVRLGEGRPTFHWYWDARWGRPFLSRWNGPAGAQTWLGVTFGRARLSGERLEVIEVADHPDDHEVACLCANREGGVWVGTEQDGLHFVQERLVRVFTTQDGLSANEVRSVCATPDGGLWVATGKGLNRWRDGQWAVQEPNGRFRAMACDRQGEPWYSTAETGPSALWTGTEPSKRRAVGLGLDWKHPNSLRFARDGTLWLACEYGLTWLRPERLTTDSRGVLVPQPASPEPACGRYAVGQQFPTNMFLTGLVEDRDGTMWVGSVAHGLFHVGQGRVDAFGPKEGLPSNCCMPVHLDDSGALWIVAEGHLVRHRDGQFQSLDARAGLPEDTLLDLIPDDLGHFWISGKHGVHRVARREIEDCFAGRLGRVRSLTLGVRDGLLTPECSSLHYPSMARTPDGHLWVATCNGLATFDPQRVEREVKPLTVGIERVVANRRNAPVATTATGTRCEVRPGSDGQVTVYFAAQTLLDADRVRFRHRLAGHDRDWLEDDLPLAYYANLPSGTYAFEVQAGNRHGLWNEQITSMPIRVLPYFWRTRAFQIEAGVLVAVFAGVFQWRRSVAQRRLQALTHQRALADEKARIAADMHDELGATLTQIAILGEVGKGQATDAGCTRATLEAISRAAREATSRMSDLVWATNPRHDTLDNLVAFLRQHAASRLESAGLEAQLDFPLEVAGHHVSATFRRNLLLVLKEALTNLVKYAAASAATVRLDLDGMRVGLRVEDNGRGFEPASRRGSGNGLGNMERRVRDLGGEFTCESTPGQGTRLVISVPLEPRSRRG